MGRLRGREIDYKEVDNETGKEVEEGNRLHELAVEFNSDKAKLEDEIDKVQASNISEADKKHIIAQIEYSIDKLQEQYDDDVAAEEQRVQENIQEQIETMDEAVNELDKQADSLKNVTMDAAATDARVAAEEAEKKKQEFVEMRESYADELQKQIEQAQTMRAHIRTRR